jgi:hypothetical protein
MSATLQRVQWRRKLPVAFKSLVLLGYFQAVQINPQAIANEVIRKNGTHQAAVKS